MIIRDEGHAFVCVLGHYGPEERDDCLELRRWIGEEGREWIGWADFAAGGVGGGHGVDADVLVVVSVESGGPSLSEDWRSTELDVVKQMQIYEITLGFIVNTGLTIPPIQID